MQGRLVQLGLLGLLVLPARRVQQDHRSLAQQVILGRLVRRVQRALLDLRAQQAIKEILVLMVLRALRVPLVLLGLRAQSAPPER